VPERIEKLQFGTKKAGVLPALFWYDQFKKNDP
jgi:hypothetical protein